VSQAFVKEGDASDDLPERPLGDRPNYVTPAGLEQLRRRQDELIDARARLVARRSEETEGALKLVERDLRYFEARLRAAVLVDRSKEKPADVRFGALVEVAGAQGVRRYAIVGEDEADPASDKLSWSSPLALALMGAKPGEEVPWEGPEGPSPLRVLSVRY